MNITSSHAGPRRTALRLGLLLSTMLAPSLVRAQDTAPAPAGQAPAGVGEIVVTAQKRSENLQTVPISVTVLGSESLSRLKIQTTEDFLKFLPSVAFTSSGPGTTHAFFRGVASGEGSNHSASLPTVGVYLDEQPITTITGELDLHTYDIARVEALAGPQGTLYGASSEAGVIRIITNKPEIGKTSGAIDLTGSTTAHGAPSGTAEGFLNLPVAENAAIRLVGWYDHEGGYIDNVERTQHFPTSNLTTNNAKLVKKNANDVTTYGGRVALRVDLNDSWTLSPTVQAQKQVQHGSFATDKTLGQLEVAQFQPSFTDDRWIQAGLTIQGKIGSVDVTYAGSYLNRHQTGLSDYSDYSYFYDKLDGLTATNNAGQIIDPSQYVVTNDHFNMISQELRFATDHTRRFRLVGGLFFNREQHDIDLDFATKDYATNLSVPGHPGDVYLTDEKRIDRDYAAFGEASFDILKDLTLTGGGRVYKYDNTLIGFFGYGSTVKQCFGGPNGPVVVPGSPCTNLGVPNADGSISPRRAERTGFLPKVNLTYHIDPRKMVYATWSKGYRPGGINRRGDLDPYKPDFLTNYEVGFKTSWMDNKVRLNGAAYYLNWSGVQFSFIGPQNLTVIQNAGNAHIKGFEFNLDLVPFHGLTVSTAGSYNDAKLASNFCDIGTSADCSGAGNSILAAKGTPLPVAAKFKGSTNVRYETPLNGMLDGFTGHIQTSLTYQTSSRNDLRQQDFNILGTRPGYTLVDAGIGVANGTWTAELFVKNLFDNAPDLYRFAGCATGTCGARIYAYVPTPRQIGLHIGRKF